MKKLALIVALLIISVIAFAQTLRLATYQYADNNRIKNISPLAGYLQAKLGCEVTVHSYPTVHAFIEAIRNNETDIALINTFGYLLLEASSQKYSMVPALTLYVRDDAKDNYKTCFVVPASSPIHSLEDAKQFAATSKLMLVATGSTSGNLVPRLVLSRISLTDVETQFQSFEYGKTHAATLQAVVNNQADIAAMGYTEYQKLESDTSAIRKIRRVWLSPEIPLGPVLLSKHLSALQQKNITEALLNLHTADTAALESLKAGWSEAKQATHYITIKTSFYDSFKKMLGKKEDLQRILTQFAN